MKKIFIFLDHDIIIRHFILNQTFLELERQYQVKYFFTDNPNRIQQDLLNLPIQGEKLIISCDLKRLSQQRKLFRALLMNKVSQKGKNYFSLQNYWYLKLKDEVMNKYFILGHRWIYPFYKKKILKSLGLNLNLKDIFLKEKPDLIIHPTVLEGVFVLDLILLSQELNIPVLYIMNSWDNPCTKPLIVGHPNWLLVWGEQTKKYAQEFLDISEKKIYKFGASQFSVYQEPLKMSIQAFRQSLNLDQHIKIILYSGSGGGRNVDEVEQLQYLEKAIEKGFLGQCKVLFRPHPWRGSREKELDFYQQNFKHIIMDPSMADNYKKSIQGNNDIYMADYQKTVFVLNSIDAVIGGISTILLESVLIGKPILCSIFDEYFEKDESIELIMNSIHLVDFFKKFSVKRSRNSEEFISDCQDLLKKSEDLDFKEKIKKKAEYFVEPFNQSYSKRLADFVKNICFSS